MLLIIDEPVDRPEADMDGALNCDTSYGGAGKPSEVGELLTIELSEGEYKARPNGGPLDW